MKLTERDKSFVKEQIDRVVKAIKESTEEVRSLNEKVRSLNITRKK